MMMMICYNVSFKVNLGKYLLISSKFIEGEEVMYKKGLAYSNKWPLNINIITTVF